MCGRKIGNVYIEGMNSPHNDYNIVIALKNSGRPIPSLMTSDK